MKSRRIDKTRSPSGKLDKALEYARNERDNVEAKAHNTRVDRMHILLRLVTVFEKLFGEWIPHDNFPAFSFVITSVLSPST